MASQYHRLLDSNNVNLTRVVLCGPKQLSNQELIFLEYKRSITSIFALYREIQKHKPDVIIGFQGQANTVLSTIKLLDRRSWIYVLRESNMQKYRISNFFQKRLLLFSYSMADRIIAQCQDMCNHIITHFNVNQSKIHIVYNFVSRPIYAIDKTEFERRNYLLVASTLSYQKNIYGALNYWKSQCSDEELHIYGHDSRRRLELMKYVRKKNISNVIFKGLESDIHYAKYRYLFMFSFYEGFSNTVLEALSQGTPVVSRDYEGGIREVINASNGFIFSNSEDVNLEEISKLSWDHRAIQAEILNKFSESSCRKQLEKAIK